MRRRGFTLIELLVVIAIIAILAAILFPVFAQAREKARQATCQSGLKQISLAMMMYYQDYDEEWVEYRHNGAGKFNVGYTWWPEMINPYTKNLDVIHCPSSPRKRTNTSATTDFWYGFGYNYLLGPLSGASHNTERNAARERPADILMAVDSTVYIVWCPLVLPNYWHDGGAAGTSTTLPLTTNPYARYQGVGDWHSNGANVLYCDGHVKYRSFNKLVDRTIDVKLWGH